MDVFDLVKEEGFECDGKYRSSWQHSNCLPLISKRYVDV